MQQPRLQPLIALALGLSLFASGTAHAICSGRFLNPATDICWTTAFPITWNSKVLFGGDQPDSDSSPKDAPGCHCGAKYGLPVGFFEPTMVVDVSTDPYCTPSLGGKIIDSIGLPGDVEGTVAMQPGNPGHNKAFYHYVAYINPIMALMQGFSDNPCLYHAPWNMLDSSAWNPAYPDDQLSAILNPDAFLYGSLPAVLAGIPHGVCSTLGTNDAACMNLRRWAHWSVGFNGNTYPLTGSIDTHNSPASTAMVIAKRALTTQHRTLRAWGTSGATGLCGYYPQPFMDDTDYKINMTFPLPQEKIDGRCGQALGASTLLWSAGHTWPVTGEDMSFMVFKKRDCCMAVGDLVDNAASAVQQ